METHPGPYANPKWSLACSALERNTSLQRRPTISGDQGGLQSPIRERPPTIVELTEDAAKKSGGSDGDSDVTLIEVGPTKAPGSARDSMDLEDGVPKADDDNGANKDSTSVSVLLGADRTESPPPKPNRPPPIPPRPEIGPMNKPNGWDSKGSDDSRLKSAAEDAARQQDVHEVMDNALFKLQCAFRSEPDEQDRDGTDIIKR
jgi:hypothetical protein